MSYPFYKIKTVSEQSHHTSPSWMVCFVRTSNVYTSEKIKKTGIDTSGESGRGSRENDYIITKNDCVSLSISNSKNSPSKTCSLNMKVSDIDYQKALAPGDWVFVWVSNYEEKINNFYEILKANDQGRFSLLTEKDSGLKFFGRILNVSNSESVGASGIKTTIQNINCQSFLELVSSVYFSYTLDVIVNSNPLTSNQNTQFDNFTNNIFKDASTQFLDSVIKSSEKKTQKKFNIAYQQLDLVTSKIFSYLMGYSNIVSGKNGEEVKISFSTPIELPKMVSKIIGKPDSKKILDIYSFISGIQKFDSGDASNNPALMSPKNIYEVLYKNVFYYTQTPTLPILVFYRPPIWRNETVWSILNQYHDSTVNEMFTSLRLNPQGKIGPVITLREIPYSTALINYIENGKLLYSEKNDRNSSQKAKQKAKEKQFTAEESLNKNRTMYYNLPRWQLPNLMIKNINSYSTDTERINFVQIQYVSSSNIVSAINPDLDLSTTNLSRFNYVEDSDDIKKNGLRADISVSNFPIILLNEFFYTTIAKKRADWLFNGHFKLNASVGCFGIEEPICEGDNIEISGILYHIQSVSHSCQISGSGKKSFNTTLQLSNGIISDSLNDTEIPIYPVQLEIKPKNKNISYNKFEDNSNFIQNSEKLK
jgi:hypothetical protein